MFTKEETKAIPAHRFATGGLGIRIPARVPAGYFGLLTTRITFAFTELITLSKKSSNQVTMRLFLVGHIFSTHLSEISVRKTNSILYKTQIFLAAANSAKTERKANFRDSQSG